MEQQQKKVEFPCLPLCSKNCNERNIIVYQYNVKKCFHPSDLAAAVDKLYHLIQVTCGLL